MKSLLSFILFIHCFLFHSQAQNVAISTIDSIAHPSAGLDVNFPNKGLLIPRVNLVSIVDSLSIPSPANSLMVYNTNPNIANGNGVGFYFYCSSNCTSKGWKYINFSDNNSSTGSEWKYYSKLTFNDTWNDQDFTSLPAHDKWKLVLDIQGNNPGYGLSLFMRINNITYNYYGMTYTSGSARGPFYGNNWHLFANSSIAFVSGEIILTGKPTTNQNIKTFTANLGCNAIYGYSMASSGFLNNDPNNLQAIKFTTLQGSPMTGRIELWYKDNQ